MSATPSQLAAAGHRTRSTTLTFEVTPGDATRLATTTGAPAVYAFPISTGSKLDVRFELGGFSTQAVEPNVTGEENKVAWSEGISLTTGEAPTVLAVGNCAGVPLFSHEIAILEGTDRHCFKLGIVPRFNQISRYVHNLTTGARADGDATSWSSNYAFSTTCQGTAANGFAAPYAAPHYGKPLQQFAAQLAAAPASFRFTLACASTAAEIDCLDSVKVNFSPPTFASTTVVSDAGSVSFRVLDTAALCGSTGTASSPDFKAALLGFLACTAWFPSEIVSFLNFQLASVVDSKFDSATSADPGVQLNACYTTQRRPVNTYRFEVVSGRVHLVRASGSAPFAVCCNVHAAATYAYHSVQDPAGNGAGGTASVTPVVATGEFGSGSGEAVCPTGYPANPAANLWRALGFGAESSTTASAFDFTGAIDLAAKRSVVTSYGLRAPYDCVGVFEAGIDTAHYTAQTLADAVGGVMNQYRGGTGAPAVAAGVQNAPAAAFTFVDSTGVSRTAVIGTAYRTPHQLAEAVGFVLNRLDARGVYASTAENLTVRDGDARLAREQRAGIVTAEQRLLWYRVVYDKVTGRYAFENREISSYRFSSYDATDAYTYPSGGTTLETLSTTSGIPAVQYPTGAATRAAFTLNFRTSDLRNATAAILGMAASTAAAARLLGFVPERAYTGMRIVSEAATGAAYRTLLTQGLLDDSRTTPAYCQRPLGSAALASGGPFFYHNQVKFRGSGPDSHVHPRLSYTVTGSLFNDQRYTVVAAHAACAASTAINPVRVTASGATYSNTLTVASATFAALPLTALVATAPISSGGTNYAVNSVFALGLADATTASALVAASAITEGGVVDGLTVLYAGDGSDTLATSLLAYQVCADGPLRIVDGWFADVPFTGTFDVGTDASRVIVHCALAVESPGVYRSTQGALPFQVGDFVELGPNASIVSGTSNLGLLTGFRFNVARVSATGAILQGSIVFTAGIPATDLVAGQHFRILQGTCMTVIRLAPVSAVVLTDTTCAFEFVTHGTGHYVTAALAGVPLFGPVPMHITGIVEEVMQPSYRHEHNGAPGFAGAFAARKTRRDPANAVASFTSSTYGRDGSLVKVRLANHCRYFSDSQPSNLAFIRPLDLPRFQLVNTSPSPETGFQRTDTVWRMFGCDGNSDIGVSVKMANEWDLQTGAGILITLNNDVGVANLHEFIARGRSVRNVLAKVDFNSALSRSWGVVHTREYSARNLQEIRVRFLDKYLRDYDFMGRSFTIQFNIHSF